MARSLLAILAHDSHSLLPPLFPCVALFHHDLGYGNGLRELKQNVILPLYLNVRRCCLGLHHGMLPPTDAWQSFLLSRVQCDSTRAILQVIRFVSNERNWLMLL